MMQRFWQCLTHRYSLWLIGSLAYIALVILSVNLLDLSFDWIVFMLLSALLLGLTLWCWRHWRSARASTQFDAMLEQQVSATPFVADPAQRQETETIRQRMLAAIATVKRSKLGQLSGTAALYELPWYMIIGNPAAGKSTAIASSGLQFPFADSKIVQGIGGTRNCDWFFTTDGILLDTAGRYAVNHEDRAEWFGFLDLLKKYRKRAPINGIIIAVSIAELTGAKPNLAIDLARNLRQRVQELTERLAVRAPVYVMFTKADLIPGFNEFFQNAERGEREKVWGATLPYSPSHSKQDVLGLFDQRFDALYDGLKEVSLANMALQRRGRMPSGIFTFPLEFSAMKESLRVFIATLFDENPYQFKPIFRGFYFTSALQEGVAVSGTSNRVAQRFELQLTPEETLPAPEQQGYFLLNLFRKVIFADQDLVAQYASPRTMRMRYGAFFAATLLLGLALGGWSWSYLGNRQLVANVQADLTQAVKLQAARLDLQSRFEALEIMQDRIEQLDQYHSNRPLALSLGLYQGELLERKLREEYFAGIKQVMLKPVGQALEAFLSDVNSGADQLAAMAKPPQSGAVSLAAQPFKEASPGNVEDAYNALKTYLMLSDKARAEGAHLNDQLTRFWRAWLEANRGAMPREQMIRSAERMIAFYLAQINDPSWPLIDSKLALIERSRESLRRVVRGMPARERVYADIKARAATRFPSMTVARIVGAPDQELVLGSYAIPGTFTRDAWEQFIQDAFKQAANGELQSADWVLKTASKDDLTLEGSPEQIQKALVELYQNEYAKQWQIFLQGVSIKELSGFDQAAEAMNRLGDPQASPINKLINTVYVETSWDQPSALGAGLKQAQSGVWNWLKESLTRQTPTPLKVNLAPLASTTGASAPMGLVAREFSGVARLVANKDKGASLMNGYLDALAKLRARFNLIKNQGDTGPGAKQFMQQTLDGSGSELADALKYVDEQMMLGINEAQKQAIRPLLVRPLMQSFAVIVGPTETEINQIWAAQVLEPFQKTLALKYPFTSESKIEASNADIGLVFGPDGALAKFFNTSIGPLVVRRGDMLSAKTWAGMGITIAPSVLASFPGWIAPLSAEGVAATAGATEAQTRFELQALPASGATEYTLDIDGQTLRWRGQPQPWVAMTWPNPQGVPGVRISAITPAGRNVLLLNEPGHFGLKKMIDAAKRNRKENGVFELSWENSGVIVYANLKISAPPSASPSASPSAPQAGATTSSQGFRRMKLPDTIVGATSQASTATLRAAP